MQPLRLACRAKDAQQVRDLVTAEIASGVIDPATIGLMAGHGYTALVKVLIEQGGVTVEDIRAGGLNTALRMASRNGHHEILALLMGVPGLEWDDVRACDNDALRWSSANGHDKVVRLLLGHGPQLVGAKLGLADMSGKCAALPQEFLRNAAVAGHVDVVNTLLGTNLLNADDVRVDDNASLRLAAGNGHIEVVQRLLRVPGMGPHDVSSHNWMAVTEATNLTQEGRRDLLNLLLTDEVLSYAAEHTPGAMQMLSEIRASFHGDEPKAQDPRRSPRFVKTEGAKTEGPWAASPRRSTEVTTSKVAKHVHDKF